MSKHPILESVLSTLPLTPALQPFALRLIAPEADLPLIHQWVNQPYAVPFWKMNGPIKLLEEAYAAMLQSFTTHSLAICLDNELVGQLDLYNPATDPIRRCYPVQDGDLGIHLLIAPPKESPVGQFTARLLYSILETLFAALMVNRIVGEPDVQNAGANRLLQKLQFQFHYPIQLPDKQANLYSLSREQFYQLAGDVWRF